MEAGSIISTLTIKERTGRQSGLSVLCILRQMVNYSFAFIFSIAFTMQATTAIKVRRIIPPITSLKYAPKNNPTNAAIIIIIIEPTVLLTITPSSTISIYQFLFYFKTMNKTTTESKVCFIAVNNIFFLYCVSMTDATAAEAMVVSTIPIRLFT